jgi:CRISPR-associated protein Cmx8
VDGATADGTQTWLKLWRDVVWGILRGVPATREPYDARAERRTIDDGGEGVGRPRQQGDASVELPSTYYLGAQARSAENVSFRDVARQRFLLHFWPFVVPIYVPAVTGRDGDREFVGYALVVPDILDLEEFVASWETVARERAPEVSGYRPRGRDHRCRCGGGARRGATGVAVAAQREGKAATKPYVTAVDVFHVEKEGNNIRTRGVTRVDCAAIEPTSMNACDAGTGVRCFAASASTTSSIRVLRPGGPAASAGSAPRRPPS